GAVSASVPSRSKSTAAMASSAMARAHQIVHVHIPAQRIDLGDRIVGHAREVGDLEAGGAAVARQLRGPYEARVLMGALGEQAQDVFGADDREEEGLGIAVDGGKEHPAAG